jgi:uncharacterized NAD(P)/FAD-binding protein YdhS
MPLVAHKEGTMRRSMVFVLMLGLALSPALATGVLAQAQTHDPTNLDLLEGRVVRIDKDHSTVEIRQSGPSMVTFTVTYDDKTYFSSHNKASSLDKLKSGEKVICLGKFDESNKMTAKRIDMRGSE